VQHNTNSLLGVVEGVDGLKTGYIDEAGYNIALTALRGETRLIAVVLGAPSSRIREEDGRNIINWGFEHFQTLRPEFGPLEPAPVWKGKQDFVDLVPVTGSPGGDSFSLTFTTYTGRGTGLRWHTEYMDPIIAPIPAGTALGDLVLSDTVGELRRIPLITPEDIEEGGFFKRLWHSIRLFFRDLFK
jgi:D-alanyl-D-alanine carboxypeptidase (penicillin-binding protein 5/6)